jgi:hypothetical protein
MARYTSRMTTVTFRDSGAGSSITVGPGPGDLSIGEVNADNAERIRVLDRGTFDGFVVGDDLEQDVSITIGVENQSLTEASLARIRDFVMKTGSFAAAVSVDSLIWAFEAVVTMNDGTTTATMILPRVQGSISFSEAKEGHTFSFSGTNNGTITVT